MTIASRNRLIRLATLMAFSLAITCIVGFLLILVRKDLPDSMPGNRPFPVPESLPFTKYSALASLVSIGLFPIFSLIALVYILFAFEKTQTVEITFFAVCAFAISLEGIRIVIPFYQLWLHPGFLSVTISRAILFSRIFTFLALLSSGIFATGHTPQQIGSSIFLLAFVSFSLSNAIPVNSGSMTSNFVVASGYTQTLNVFMGIIGFLAFLSYYIPGKTRGIPEYRQVSGGIILFLAGYMLLTVCDSWLFLVEGSVLLIFGAGVYLDRLHRYYLWQ
jgi:hypothetical protein